MRAAPPYNRAPCRASRERQDAPRERTLRLGIVGCGRATIACHVPALRATRAVRVVSLADLDDQRRSQAGSLLGIDALYRDAAELLAGVPVDAVGICVPAGAHAPVVEEVLAAGRHVLVEKPLARTLDDCDRIIGAAASSGLTVAVGLNYRSHSLIRETKRILATGALGKLVLITTSMTDAALRRPELPAWVHEDGPSAMFEKGVHHFDLWRFLGDSEVTTVLALGASDPHPGDATAGVLARLDSGTVCTTGLSGEGGFGQHITLCGEAQRLDVNLEPPRPLEPAKTAGRRGATAERHAALTGWMQESPSTVLTAGPEDRIASYTAEWEDFAAAVREGRPAAATVEDGRAAVKIAQAVNRSLFETQPVARSL